MVWVRQCAVYARVVGVAAPWGRITSTAIAKVQFSNLKLNVVSKFHTNSKPDFIQINLQLKKGEITTLIGPNGGGKTSIARILIGVIKVSHGEVLIEKNYRIGYMPQKLVIDNTIPIRVIDFINLSSLKNYNSKWQLYFRGINYNCH